VVHFSPSSKISENHQLFWRRKSLHELPKNPFWDFGPVGINTRTISSLVLLLLELAKQLMTIFSCKKGKEKNPKPSLENEQ
jgi:hypothetical protein